ncbi:MAG: acetate--CoA ligase family protein [Patescibacteria group bacterium]
MNFKPLFYPKSIAIVGASRRKKTVGNDVVKNLVKQGFAGKIYPVNPKAKELYGKKVYSHIDEIKDQIDLLVIAIPAAHAFQVIKEAHEKKNTKAFIVISAGFGEIGNKKGEEEISNYCKEKQIVLIGPNCLGVINPKVKMNASFAAIMPNSGTIAFVSQSGAICTSVLDYAEKLKLGFSKFVSIGNKIIVDELSLLKYLKDDPQTKVITMYTEQLVDAPKFIKTVKEITTGKNAKPVIILKSGKTDAGSAAVASHTGSLSGGSAAYDALFEQAGVIQAQSISQLFDFAALFSENKMSEVKTVAIITNAGGPGVLTTDAVVGAGLKLAELSSETKKKLSSFLPQAANIKNPVDVLGDAVAQRYKKTLELVEADKNVDALVLILTPQSMTEIEATAQTIVKLKKKTKKPIIVSFMGQETIDSGVEIMEDGGVTTSLFPEPAGAALAAMSKFAKNKVSASPSPKLEDLPAGRQGKSGSATTKQIGEVKQIFAKAKKSGKTSFPEAEALPIFKARKLPILEAAQAASAEEAVKVAKKVGTKLAMKIVSQDILHKSDVGGVTLNVTAKTVAEDYRKMMKTVKKNKPKAKLDGVLLMEMAEPGGIEMILGAKKIAKLGTLIMLGMGGVYVEIIKDTQMAFAPLTNSDINRMINKLKMHEILKGARGQKAYDIKALKEAIKNISQLVLDFPEIRELDINPLMIFPEGQGVKVLDGRMVIE